MKHVDLMSLCLSYFSIRWPSTLSKICHEFSDRIIFWIPILIQSPKKVLLKVAKFSRKFHDFNSVHLFGLSAIIWEFVMANRGEIDRQKSPYW